MLPITPDRYLASEHKYLTALPAKAYDVGRYKDLEHKAMLYAAAGIDMPHERILKTVFFESVSGRLYGAVLPALSRVDLQFYRSAAQGFIRSRRDDYLAAYVAKGGLAQTGEQMIDRRLKHRLRLSRAKHFPYKTRPGSCGPFPAACDLEYDETGFVRRGGIAAILVDVDDWDARYDFALPGSRDLALHATLSDIMRTLRACGLDGPIARASFQLGKAKAIPSTAMVPITS